MSLEISKAMKRFNQFSINKSKRYVNHLIWIEESLENHYNAIELLIKHKEDLKAGNCPSLDELKSRNIIKKG